MKKNGLKGNYDVTLNVTEEDYRTLLIRAGVNAGVALPPEALRLLDGGSPTSFFDALQKLCLRYTRAASECWLEGFPRPMVAVNCVWRDVLKILSFADELLVENFHGSGQSPV